MTALGLTIRTAIRQQTPIGDPFCEKTGLKADLTHGNESVTRSVYSQTTQSGALRRLPAAFEALFKYKKKIYIYTTDTAPTIPRSPPVINYKSDYDMNTMFGRCAAAEGGLVSPAGLCPGGRKHAADRPGVDPLRHTRPQRPVGARARYPCMRSGRRCASHRAASWTLGASAATASTPNRNGEAANPHRQASTPIGFTINIVLLQRYFASVI